MIVPIKLTVATNKKKCVPPVNAGEANAIQKIPRTCRRNTLNNIHMKMLLIYIDFII